MAGGIENKEANMQNYIDLAGALYKLPEGWTECAILGSGKPRAYNRAMGRMCEVARIGDKVYIVAEELIELKKMERPFIDWINS